MWQCEFVSVSVYMMILEGGRKMCTPRIRDFVWQLLMVTFGINIAVLDSNHGTLLGLFMYTNLGESFHIKIRFKSDREP